MLSDNFLTAAMVHYHGGRYRLAAEAFASASNEVPTAMKPKSLQGPRKRKRPATERATGDDAGPLSPSPKRAMEDGEALEAGREGAFSDAAASAASIFGALPSLAALADAALCRARSALESAGPSSLGGGGLGSSGSASISTRSLLQSALDANGAYVRALISASVNLRRAEAAESSGRRKRGPSSVGGSSDVVVNTHRTQLACAAVMAGVSASWLRMGLGDADGAAGCLLDAARVAASCFWGDGACDGTAAAVDGTDLTILPPIMLRITTMEALHIVRKLIVVEGERGRYALRTFQNAMNVVGLVSGRMESVLDAKTGVGSVASLNVGDVPTYVADNTGSSKTKRKEESVRKGKIYDDGSVSVEDEKLQVQELLTRALRQHKCLGEQSFSDKHSKEVILNKRNALISDAVAIQSDGPAGLARRLQILLQGLEVLSQFTRDPVAHPKNALSEIIRGLGSLAPFSRTACRLLGCLHAATKWDYKNALDMFQGALEMDEKCGLAWTSEHEETLSNMAHCFSLLGEAKPAQELLLQILTSAQSMTSRQNSSEVDCGPLVLALTNDECRTSENDDTSSSNRRNSTRLLWRLLHTSTLADDWATCLAASEALCRFASSTGSTSDKMAAHCAHIFALSQAHRPSLALNKCNELYVTRRHLMEVRNPLSIAFDLYEADATISTETGFNNDPKENGTCEGVLKVCELTNRSQVQLDSYAQADNGEASDKQIPNIGIIVKNNRGIAMLMAGKTLEAMRCFQGAALAAREATCGPSPVSDTGSQSTEMLYLQPHFNLALLLWREGHREEAVKVWMAVRGLGKSVAVSSNSQTSQLRAALEEAINRHGLFCAKKTTCGHAIGGEHIPTWRAGRHSAGLSKDQIFALDIMVLQHAVALSGRKGASMYTRKHGGLLR